MKLLMELNMQENVTMVMVTHDPNLKYFAHRSFHLMDGRIYNIEEMDVEARDYKIKALGIAPKNGPQPGNNTVNIRVEQHGAQPGSSVPSSSQQPAGAPLDKRTLEDCKMTVVRDGQFYAKSLGNSLA